MEQVAAEYRIRQLVASVAGIDPRRIGDPATRRGDLNLDALSLLEIGVEAVGP